MNAVHLVGTVVRDPRVVEKDDRIISNIVLAIPWSMKDRDGVDYVSCVGFKRVGELIRDYVTKGSRVGVTGKVSTSKYTASNGETKYATEILVQSIEFLGCKGKKTSSNNSSSSVEGSAKDAVQSNTQDVAFGFEASEDDIPDIELPF